MPKQLPKPPVLHRDGTNQAGRLQAALNPDYVSVDERSVKDLLAFAQEYAKELKYYNAKNQEEGDWSAFLRPDVDIDQVVAFMNQPERFQGEGASPYRRPHFVLFLTFLQLLRHTQQQLNTLTKRHLDFYYQQVLRMSKKTARPDHVNVLVELAGDVDQVELPAGTLLNAGTDSLGQDLFYQTDRNIVVNHAQVERVSSVYADKQVTGIRVARDMHPGPKDEKFIKMLEIALGNPKPGDPLPTYPGGKADGKAVDYKLLKGLYELVSYVKTGFHLSFSEFRELMRLKTQRDQADKEWNQINAILIVMLINATLLEKADRKDDAEEEWKNIALTKEQRNAVKAILSERAGTPLTEKQRNAIKAILSERAGTPLTEKKWTKIKKKINDIWKTTPRNFNTNLRKALALGDPEDFNKLFDGVREVETINDLYEKRIRQQVKEFVWNRLYLPIEDFISMMQVKDRIDKEWEEINRILQKAGQEKREDPTYVLFLFLFSADSEIISQLEAEKIPAKLQKAFKDNSISLSDNVTVSVKVKTSEWLLTDQKKGKSYVIRQEPSQEATQKPEKQLTIYPIPTSNAFDENLIAAVGPLSFSNFPTVKTVGNYYTAFREVKAFFWMSAEDFSFIMSVAEKGDATKREWDKVYEKLEEAYRKKVYAGRRDRLKQLREEHGFAAMIDFAVGDEGAQTELTSLQRIKEYISKDEDAAFLDQINEKKGQDKVTETEWDRVYRIVELVQRVRLPEPVAQREEWLNLYPAEDATTAGVTLDIEGDEEDPRWKTFGQGQPSVSKESPPPASFGWALSSPILALSQGKRSIDLTLEFSPDRFDLKKICTALGFSPFRVQVSTEKGWVEPDTGVILIEAFLFSADSQLSSQLDAWVSEDSELSSQLGAEKSLDKLRKAFEGKAISFSANITVSVKIKTREWLLTDKDNRKTYIIRKESAPLFSADSVSSIQLDAGKFPAELQKAFEDKEISLSANVTVSVKIKTREWLLTDEDKKKAYIIRKEWQLTDEGNKKIYIIRKESTPESPNQLNIYIPNVLQFQLTFGENVDPIAPSPVEAGLIHSPWPVLRVMLRQIWQLHKEKISQPDEKKKESGRYITHYQPFKGLVLVKTHVQVSVSGLANFQIQNDETVLDAQKPFEPFGTSPSVGSRFYLGHPEVVYKKLDSLTFQIEWMGAPENMAAHYKNYDEPTSATDEPTSATDESTSAPDKSTSATNDSFTARVSLVDRRLDIQLAKEAKLFNSTDATTTHSINLPDAPVDKPEIQEPEKRPLYKRDHEIVIGEDLQSWDRYLQWELNPPDFQHEAYPTVAAKKSIELAGAMAKAATIEAEDFQVNPPYTPKIKSLTLGYTSSVEITLEEKPGSQPQPDRIFHIQPFGYNEIQPDSPSQRYLFLPQYNNEGELYIGIRDVHPPQNLSLLFQMAEGSADPDLEPVPVQWSYLSGNRWMSLDDGNLLRDTTRGFINSGIIEFDLEPTQSSTLLPPELYWIRATIAQRGNSVCDTVAIHAQAVSATFDDHDNAPDHLSRPLPAGNITALAEPQPEVTGIRQPYTSYGGKMAEQDSTFYTRISERLRHKHRAQTMWDYEHMILEQFPQIYKAKCLPVDLTEHPEDPGRVEIVVIPDIKNKRPFNPFEPKAPSDLLLDIETYLKDNIPTFATVKVKNAHYVQVKVRFAVRFLPGYNEGYYKQRLNKDLNRFLSPWAYEEGADIVIGGKIYASSIVNFLDRRPYVDFIAAIKLFSSDDGRTSRLAQPSDSEGYFVTTDRLDGVLVAARRHEIDIISEVGYEHEIFTGINYMKIELDFIVG